MQSVTVPRIFSGTGTSTFFQDQCFPVPVPVLFLGPIFSGTGKVTLFRDQFVPVPVPGLFSGTNFFLYHPKKRENSWDRDNIYTHNRPLKGLFKFPKTYTFFQGDPGNSPVPGRILSCTRTGTKFFGTSTGPRGSQRIWGGPIETQNRRKKMHFAFFNF